MAQGLRGFQEKGEAGYALTAGSVLGVRWFWMKADSLSNPFAEPGQSSQAAAPVLYGQTGFSYAPGGVTAEAECATPPRPRSLTRRLLDAAEEHAEEHEVPADSCGCGFWAYWDAAYAGRHSGGGGGGLPVLGVIEATGRVIHGELGFRAQKARIAALSPGFDIRLEFSAPAGYDPEGEITLAGRRVEYMGRSWAAADLAAAAQACMADCETRLGRAYQVPVYSSQAAMLALHPPGRGFLS